MNRIGTGSLVSYDPTQPEDKNARQMHPRTQVTDARLGGLQSFTQLAALQPALPDGRYLPPGLPSDEYASYPHGRADVSSTPVSLAFKVGDRETLTVVNPAPLLRKELKKLSVLQSPSHLKYADRSGLPDVVDAMFEDLHMCTSADFHKSVRQPSPVNLMDIARFLARCGETPVRTLSIAELAQDRDPKEIRQALDRCL